MVLHQDVPDRFVDVTEQEHQEKGSVEQIIGDVNGGLDQKEHEQDFQHGAEGGVTGCPVGIIHAPVCHTDQCHTAVDDEHPGGNLIRGS